MKKINRSIFNNILLTLLTAFAVAALSSAATFAVESDITTESTDVILASSIEEFSSASEKADNEAFFTIDASESDTPEELADEDTDRKVEDILSGNGSSESKQEELIDVLEESDMYLAAEGDDSTVEVTSLFAFQRLRLNAPYNENLMAYGALSAVYYDGYYMLSYESEEATRDAYNALIKEYGAASVIIDVPMKAEAFHGWGTKHMGLHLSPSSSGSTGGKKVRVAVLDSGITRNHEIFKGNTILQGYDIYNSDSDPADDEGHGTAVSGIIAESTYFNVEILPVKIIGRNGSGSLLDILNGIKYAEKKNADIINLSVGGYVGSTQFASLENELKGVKALIVCASGNDSLNMNSAEVNSFPGEISKVVCVSAIAADDSFYSISNYGNAVDFCAPGKSLYVANKNGKYELASGTSFASPYIAATAAKLKYENRSASNDKILSLMRSKSIDLGSKGKDVYYGYGYPCFLPKNSTPTKIDITNGKGKDIEVQIGDIRERVAYTGSPIKQKPELIVEGRYLKQGTDYTITYKNNVNAGTAQMTFVGKGNYTGKITGKTFTITPRLVGVLSRLSFISRPYTGKVQTPTVKSVYDGKPLKIGTDYNVYYQSGRKNVGKYTVKIVFKGNFTGVATTSFRITKAANPITVSGKTVTVRAKDLKNNSKVFSVSKVLAISKAQGKLSYNKLSPGSYASVNKTNGSITVKENTKKGTYKVRVKVSAAGNSRYNADFRTAVVTIVVK